MVGEILSRTFIEVRHYVTLVLATLRSSGFSVPRLDQDGFHTLYEGGHKRQRKQSGPRLTGESFSLSAPWKLGANRPTTTDRVEDVYRLRVVPEQLTDSEISTLVFPGLSPPLDNLQCVETSYPPFHHLTLSLVPIPTVRKNESPNQTESGRRTKTFL